MRTVKPDDKLVSCKGGLLWNYGMTECDAEECCENNEDGLCLLPFIDPLQSYECKVYDVVGFAEAVGTVSAVRI